MNIWEVIHKKICEAELHMEDYVKHLDLPENMCNICKFLFMYAQGYTLGVLIGSRRTGVDWNAKGDAILHFEQEFKWLSPKEQKQGFIDK